MIPLENKENGETNDKTPREVLDDWVKDQDEKVQTMIIEATAGLKSALGKEREAAKESTRLEKELAEANKKLDAYKTDEEKDLEDSEKKVATLTTERDEATVAEKAAVKKLDEARIGFAITIEALKQGLSDPEDAKALLGDHDVKYNEETGKVEGAEKAIKALIKEKPYLVVGAELGTPRTDSKRKLTDAAEKAPPTGIRF